MAKRPLSARAQFNMQSEVELVFYKKAIEAAIDKTDKIALKQFAEDVAEEAKRNVPVKTGVLKNSIKGNVRKKRNGRPGEHQASISTNTKKSQNGRKRKYGYGLDVEVGRTNYTNTPYLRPAFKKVTRELPSLMQRIAARRAAEQSKSAPKRGRPKKS